ncbi:MAG: ATP-binding cassette domain-containing protein [Firmicutes bacterium]|nr:ATP-binding cassette domain-containing protein [Bacillota bacterium]
MIRLSAVSIKLGDFLLDNINLTIHSGEFFTILGPTGSGKTVILELIAGLYRPDAGKVLIDEVDAANIPPEKREIGFVYQDYALFPHLNVFKNIAFGLQIRKISPSMMKKSVKEMADMMKISHLLGRYPGTLSGGEQQRVSLARALIMKPKILLMDEPLSALDPNTKWVLCEELKKIHEKYRCTIIHVTHDFNETNILADRIAVLLKGKVRQVGVSREIFEKNGDQEVAQFLGIGPIKKAFACSF